MTKYIEENRKKFHINDTLSVLMILLALCLLLSCMVGKKFTSVDNLMSVGLQFSFIAIMAIGMTIVILTGGIDLSVGSIYAIAGVVTAVAMTNYGLPWGFTLIIGLIVGVLCGLVNGLLITVNNLPPFIATLGMMSIARGLAYQISKGYPIKTVKQFKVLGTGKMFGIVPNPFVVMIILAIIFAVILGKTILGRRIYALGGNEGATNISGINTNNIKLIVYSLCGLLAGIAGILQTARLGTAQSVGGIGYELDAIAAVIIGGASMNGGKGKIINTLIGAALMGVLKQGLVLLSCSPYWQQTIIGVVIIAAVTVDQLRYNARSKK